MNLLNSFLDFYRELSSDGLFFFWIVIFLFCFLLFLTIILVVKNKKLVKILKEDDVSFIENNNEEDIPVSDISINNIEDKKEKTSSIKEVKIEVEEQVKEEVKNIEDNGPYKKNVLREMNARRQTSPISISSDNYSDNIYTDRYKEEDFGFEESYLREESISPLEEMEDYFEVNDNMKFASEIVERMEEEIKPSNIELTDYEKKQEEEAIISYDELIKVKDKIYNITEDEETDEFIDQLKSFRLDL